MTALTLSILSEPEQQADASLIVFSKESRTLLSLINGGTGSVDSSALSKRVELSSLLHQNYSYEDFVEGLKASVIETPDGSSVVYVYESGILKRIAYRALYAWLTGGCPVDSSMSETELAVVRDWLDKGTLPKQSWQNVTLTDLLLRMY